jgi:ectoine utilization protein EutC
MARDIRIVTEADLRRLAPLDLATVDAIEAAFAALAGGGVVMPPVLSMDIAEAHGEVDVKTAHIRGTDSFAIKVSPGFFDNPKLGLPSLNGLMIVLSARTGLVEAVLLDNGYLTDLRTAAAGAVAARHLAPDPVQTAAVLGTGAQARLQMRAAHLVRPFARCLVWGRDPARARACAADIGAALGIETGVAATAQEAVRVAQLVVTATPARDPLVQADWLHPGLHITAMGSDQAGKNEIAPAALGRADLYAADRVAQCATLGELRAARAAGLIVADPPELGDIVAGAHPGRTRPDQITLADLTGTGVQDTAIAAHVLAHLGDAGVAIRA